MEIDVDNLDAPRQGRGHGGARRGAGRKPASYEKPVQVVDFEVARARNEAAKAERNEFDLAVLKGLYLPREAIQQAAATAKSAFAQALRAVPDTLESDGIPPDVCHRVSLVIDAALEELANDLDMLAGESTDE